jgi:phosphate transport system permease protein
VKADPSRPLRLTGARAGRPGRLVPLGGELLLFLVTVASAAVILFIFYFIIRDAVPFFRSRGFAEFFTGREWYPAASPPSFGALAIFYGSAMVTLGALAIAVPVGVTAAVCLSDVLPFSVRQAVKPVVEVLAAIPSVAYGFFALVVFVPVLQEKGGPVLAAGAVLAGVPLAALSAVFVSDLATARLQGRAKASLRAAVAVLWAVGGLAVLGWLFVRLNRIQISSGTNALNVSAILAIMALPTVVSVAEDALSAVGRELREASYGLGSTRAETIVRVVIPAAGSGILAAVLLGMMRAVGETMVVWMASGNAAQIPKPWYNFLAPVRTLTATIAGDMGEADHVTGSDRYSALFAMALCLLVFSLACNLVSEWAVRRSRKAR